MGIMIEIMIWGVKGQPEVKFSNLGDGISVAPMDHDANQHFGVSGHPEVTFTNFIMVVESVFPVDHGRGIHFGVQGHSEIKF